MLKCFFLLVGIVFIPLAICLRGLILGPGRWLVLHMGHCENPEQYPMFYEVNRKKINRTHDCFNVHMSFDRDVNMSYSLQIDVFQEVDGGFKFYETIKDDCYCAFLMRHAGENMRRGLSLANIDPPECPFWEGEEVILNNFVMDYRELAKHGVYGTFLANLYFIYNGEKYVCVQTILNFDEYENDNDDDDEEDDEDDNGGVINRFI